MKSERNGRPPLVLREPPATAGKQDEREGVRARCRRELARFPRPGSCGRWLVPRTEGGGPQDDSRGNDGRAWALRGDAGMTATGGNDARECSEPLLPSCKMDRSNIMTFTRITADPARMSGVPCIRDLRIPVATVVGMVADGMTEPEILEAYPDLEAADIREALHYAAEAVTERVLPLAVNG